MAVFHILAQSLFIAVTLLIALIGVIQVSVLPL